MISHKHQIKAVYLMLVSILLLVLVPSFSRFANQHPTDHELQHYCSPKIEHQSQPQNHSTTLKNIFDACEYCHLLANLAINLTHIAQLDFAQLKVNVYLSQILSFVFLELVFSQRIRAPPLSISR